MLLGKLLGRRAEGHVLGNLLHAMGEGREPSSDIDFGGHQLGHWCSLVFHQLLDPLASFAVHSNAFSELSIPAERVLRVHPASCRPTTPDVARAVEDESEWRHEVRPSTLIRTDIG